MSRVTVVGCGHVGLVTAAGLAELGHEVRGVDVDVDLVHELNHGKVRLHEPGLTELVAGADPDRLGFTTDYSAAIPGAEFIILAVDTPQTIAGAANLRSLRKAVESIAASLTEGDDPIIVVKSTSPIGTGETVEELLRAHLGADGIKPRVVTNPEFLRQGHAVDDFRNPTRIVVGTSSVDDAHRVIELYSGLDTFAPVIVTTTRTAEMIKYVANAFLATRVSFINEVAALCEAVGADVDWVVRGIAGDPRIGEAMFVPGIGYGGSCLPKDVAALRFAGSSAGVATPVLAAVQEVNAIAPMRILRRLREHLGTLEGKRIGVWGLTFKGGTEDVRNSPASDVVDLLLNEGAQVSAHDPALATEWWRGSVVDASEAIRGADALLVLSDWPQFRAIDPKLVADDLAGTLVVDGRNVLNGNAYREAGLTYVGVGRIPDRKREAVPA